MTPELVSGLAVLASAFGGVLLYLLNQAKKGSSKGDTSDDDVSPNALLERVISLEAELGAVRKVLDTANTRIRELEIRLARSDERNQVLTEILERFLRPHVGTEEE